MAEESSPTTWLDSLTEHVGKDRSPLSFFDQLFFDLFDLFQQILAADDVLLHNASVDASSVHFAQNLVQSLSTLGSTLQWRSSFKVMISQSLQDHTMFVSQIVHLDKQPIYIAIPQKYLLSSLPADGANPSRWHTQSKSSWHHREDGNVPMPEFNKLVNKTTEMQEMQKVIPGRAGGSWSDAARRRRE